MYGIDSTEQQDHNHHPAGSRTWRLSVFALIGATLGALVGAADSLSLNDTFTALLALDFGTIAHGLTASGNGVPALSAAILGAACAVLLGWLAGDEAAQPGLKPRTFP